MATTGIQASFMVAVLRGDLRTDSPVVRDTRLPPCCAYSRPMRTSLGEQRQLPACRPAFAWQRLVSRASGGRRGIKRGATAEGAGNQALVGDRLVDVRVWIPSRFDSARQRVEPLHSMQLFQVANPG